MREEEWIGVEVAIITQVTTIAGIVKTLTMYEGLY